MVLHRPVEPAAFYQDLGQPRGAQLAARRQVAFTFDIIGATIGRVPMLMAKKPKKTEPFGVQEYLSNAGVSRRIAKFNKGQVIFSQDDPCDDVLYIQSGNAKLTIVNPQGKEAVLAIVGPGDFLGEGCIIGNPVRMATATAIAPLSAMSIQKKEMMRVLHDEQEFAGKFISYMLERNIKIEADLVDQLFNSSEKRLARALLILARYGKAGEPETLVAKISQETLAELVGTTRSRVNFFMNKFRKLGFIHYNGGLQVHSSLLNVVLHDH
jgi:CRP/FNR family transcriptional regulator, cyclic AMP receptor protein